MKFKPQGSGVGGGFERKKKRRNGKKEKKKPLQITHQVKKSSCRKGEEKALGRVLEH